MLYLLSFMWQELKFLTAEVAASALHPELIQWQLNSKGVVPLTSVGADWHPPSNKNPIKREYNLSNLLKTAFTSDNPQVPQIPPSINHEKRVWLEKLGCQNIASLCMKKAEMLLILRLFVFWQFIPNLSDIWCWLRICF